LGFSLLILSIIAIPFGISWHVIIVIFLTVFLSSFPDIDVKIGISHRTITHTILFALIAGITFGVLFGAVIKEDNWYLLGFLAGFGGVLLHLVGDLMSYMKFKPLYPFSSRKVAFGWFRADDIIANYGFFILGWIAFFVYLVNSSETLSSLF